MGSYCSQNLLRPPPMQQFVDSSTVPLSSFGRQENKVKCLAGSVGFNRLVKVDINQDLGLHLPLYNIPAYVRQTVLDKSNLSL